MEIDERRWTEIRFYLFSKDIYEIKKDLLDITTIIEGIALITPNSKPERLKGLSAKLLTDITARPKLTEIIFLMNKHNYTLQKIGTTVGKTREAVRKILKEKDPPLCLPTLKESDDILIANFLKTLDKIQKAGITNVN